MSTTTTTPDLSVSTTEHPNVARIREAFAAFGRGDLDAVRASLTEDCTWTNAGSGPISGEFTGWESISDMFAALFEATDGTYAMQVVSMLADDQHAIAIYDATWTVSGVTATYRFVLVDELAGDGRTTATHTLAYDQAGADRHLSGVSDSRAADQPS